jgi:hypothetical protein
MRLAPVLAHPKLFHEARNDPKVWESFRYVAMYASINLTTAYDAREPEVVWEDELRPLPEHLVGYDLLPTRLASFPNRASPATVGLIHTRSPWWVVLVPQEARTLKQAQFFVPGDLDNWPDDARDAAVCQATPLLQEAP